MPWPRVFTSGGSGGGAPSGAAGGDLSGTYPNPTVATVGGHTAVTTADTGTVTSAMILDGTIVSGDLSATAGITSGQLAGSIAPSKVTGTAITAADTGTVTSTMILDGTIVNADLNASAAVALSKLASGTNGDLVGTASGATANVKRPNYFMMRTNALAETIPRNNATFSNTIGAPTSGTISFTAIELQAGMAIGHITFMSGTTAGSAMTHQWFCLTDSALNQVATTSDDTSTAWGASAEKTLAIATIASGASATYTVPTAGLYYVGVCVTGTTLPTMTGTSVVANTGPASLPPSLFGTSDTGLTSPPAFTKTYGAITATLKQHWAWVS